MGYWKRVFRRVIREAAKDAKLDTWANAVIALAAQGLTSVGIWVLVGFSDATFWTRFFAAALPFITFPAAFIIRLWTVPPSMAQEDADKIEALAAAKSEKKAVLERLYVESGPLLDNILQERSRTKSSLKLTLQE